MRGGGPAVRNGIAATIAIAATAGGLLASGALDPLMSDGIAMLIGDDADEPATLNASRVTDWMYRDDRPEWSTLRKVPAPPAAVPGPDEPRRPAIAPPENPHRFQFNGPASMPHYSLAPPPDCPQPHGPGHDVQRLTATPGTGSATVSWWDLGDPDTGSYSIAVVPNGVDSRPNRGPDSTSQVDPVREVTVDAPQSCQDMSVSITGLKSGDTYRFWLTANNTSQAQGGRAYRHTRGETETVTIK